MNAGGHIIPASFGRELERYAADQLERDLLRAMVGPFGAATEDQRLKAKAIRERIVSEGKLIEVLEAMVPEPCPECGEIPSR